MAKLERYAYPLPGAETYNYERQSDALDELQKRSDALAEGEVEGAVLRWQRGDGYAFYLVTKDRPLTLQWIPFGDNWTVENALIRGLTREDVLGQLRSRRALNEFFGR